MLKTDVNKRNETVLTDEWLGQIHIQEPSWYKWQTLSMPVALGNKLGTEWAKLHSRAQQEQCAKQQRCRIWDAALLYSFFVQVQGSTRERVKLGSSFSWPLLRKHGLLIWFLFGGTGSAWSYPLKPNFQSHKETQRNYETDFIWVLFHQSSSVVRMYDPARRWIIVACPGLALCHTQLYKTNSTASNRLQAFPLY